MAPPAGKQEVHKAGPLKQQNKGHKRGKHRSKGALQDELKGRVEGAKHNRRQRFETSKNQRRSQHRLMLKQKRQEAIDRRRSAGGVDAAPRLIAVVGLTPDINLLDVCVRLKQAAGDDAVEVPEGYFGGPLTFTVPSQKQRMTILPCRRDPLAVIEAAKCADVLLFVLSTGAEVDEIGEYSMTCVRAQGVPAVAHAVVGLGDVAAKRKGEVRKLLLKYVQDNFPKEDKLLPLDSAEDAALLLRHVANLKLQGVVWRDRHANVLSHGVSFEPYAPEAQAALHEGLPPHQKEAFATETLGELLITGYIRSRPLSANALVHVPGFGDFQLAYVAAAEEPVLLKGRRTAGDVAMDDVSLGTDARGARILAVPNERQESLVAEVTPDPMAGEQTWPTEEEMADAESSTGRARRDSEMEGGDGDAVDLSNVRARTRRVPKGTSEYQAAWIVDSDSEDEDEEGGDADMASSVGSDEEFSDDDGERNVPDAAHEAMSEAGDGRDGGTIAGGSDEDEDEIALGSKAEKYDETVDADEEQQQYEEFLRAKERAAQEEDFPDEVDTPRDILARVRFQRFRGLKSFKNSPWDPKENLPLEYARIFQFQNFDRTRKRVLGDVEGVPTGRFVTLHIKAVPASFMASYRPEDPLVVFSLLQHENKMSVVHFAIKRHPGYTDPIPAKSELIFFTGIRSFVAAPIFSQHTLGDKQKAERFLQMGHTVVASVFAPLQYPPGPVLVFKRDAQGMALVATGALLGVNPDRVVVKKIVLTGHPYHIHKRSAVIRYMFYNRDDIMWFKPVELWTKYGRRGHIREPLGTHGHMKVVFDGQIKNQDTICMSLYKRIFPPWSCRPFRLEDVGNGERDE